MSLLHSLLTGFYNDAKANQLNHYYEAKVAPVFCIAKDPIKRFNIRTIRVTYKVKIFKPRMLLEVFET